MGLALEYFSWVAGDGGLGDALIQVNGHYIQYRSKAIDEQRIMGNSGRGGGEFCEVGNVTNF